MNIDERTVIKHQGDAFWQSCLLLGFDGESYNALEGGGRLDFGPNMFGQPDEAGMACILHFLIPLLLPDYKKVGFSHLKRLLSVMCHSN